MQGNTNGGHMTREQAERIAGEIAAIRESLTGRWAFRTALAWGVVLGTPLAAFALHLLLTAFANLWLAYSVYERSR